jgi:hypothetical protein
MKLKQIGLPLVFALTMNSAIVMAQTASTSVCTTTLSCDGKGKGTWVYKGSKCQKDTPYDANEACKCVPANQAPKTVIVKPTGATTYCPKGTPPPGGYYTGY